MKCDLGARGASWKSAPTTLCNSEICTYYTAQSSGLLVGALVLSLLFAFFVSLHRGNCIVQQCNEPCCTMTLQQLMPTISRPGNAAPMVFIATRSQAS